MKKSLSLVAALILGAVAVSPALAGVGLQTGLSVDPDDFLIGVHFRSHPIAEDFVIVPSAEAGFGDVTMIAGNLDLHYNFKTSSDLAPYVGGGVTLNWFDWNSGSDTKVGGSILGGIDLTPKIYLEAKIGLGDVPDWKFIVGFNR
ncbi:MAG TPA: hypothetical protein VFH88_11475 [Candidatus Krumholzibacteria bacterium]|nr:hypothetical protein [Candidatus Krumholzibacteria bacterium]